MQKKLPPHGGNSCLQNLIGRLWIGSSKHPRMLVQEEFPPKPAAQHFETTYIPDFEPSA
ncbi:hypothetical protein ABIE13_000331 [Ottowia thiooxydans]|uniref:Uncharacterized protein n=1 Tax=Ottowia thiooxydans TaxID=219182 RepID=A0ABV2Q2J2_9BURK